MSVMSAAATPGRTKCEWDYTPASVYSSGMGFGFGFQSIENHSMQRQEIQI